MFSKIIYNFEEDKIEKTLRGFSDFLPNERRDRPDDFASVRLIRLQKLLTKH